MISLLHSFVHQTLHLIYFFWFFSLITRTAFGGWDSVLLKTLLQTFFFFFGIFAVERPNQLLHSKSSCSIPFTRYRYYIIHIFGIFSFTIQNSPSAIPLHWKHIHFYIVASNYLATNNWLLYIACHYIFAFFQNSFFLIFNFRKQYTSVSIDRNAISYFKTMKQFDDEKKLKVKTKQICFVLYFESSAVCE